MPNIKARPSEIADMGSEINPPGAKISIPLLWIFVASIKNRFKLKSNFDKTSIDINDAPKSNKTAFIICTHVVASMPPKVT